MLCRYSTSGGLPVLLQLLKTVYISAASICGQKKWRTKVRHKLPRKNVPQLLSKPHMPTDYIHFSVTQAIF
jgi:hypothetical protein